MSRSLLGIFAHTDAVTDALRELAAKRIPVVEVFSPVPDEEILALAASARSPVRFATLGGALSGLVTGLGLALLTTAVWELVVGGKPVYAIVPFVVVGFELTILLGALATLLGLLLFARLPFRRFPAPAYRPEFSDDRFGVQVEGSAEQLDAARGVLARAGAVDVQDIDGDAPRGGAR
jgi:molybdopterin-containing oxidoreductase family membrane subunit